MHISCQNAFHLRSSPKFIKEFRKGPFRVYVVVSINDRVSKIVHIFFEHPWPPPHRNVYILGLLFLKWSRVCRTSPGRPKWFLNRRDGVTPKFRWSLWNIVENVVKIWKRGVIFVNVGNVGKILKKILRSANCGTNVARFQPIRTLKRLLKVHNNFVSVLIGWKWATFKSHFWPVSQFKTLKKYRKYFAQTLKKNILVETLWNFQNDF